MTHMPYRGDIDGLRAVSVLVVILFHAGLSGVGGGYIGVDVFFVISGYLISGMIVLGLERSDFSLGDFYRRRMARILPSLAITLILTLALGFVLFNTRQFDLLGKEAAFAAFGLSNILFSSGVDYFADEQMRPLLHTWSLGVEEQFYLIWPAVLIFACTMMRLPSVIVIMVTLAAAFAFSAMATHADRPASYFLLQYRAYELLLGALAFEIERRTRTWLDARPAFKTGGTLAGIAALAAAIVLYDKTTSFPGHAALLPTIATVALILLAPGTSIGAALAWRPLVTLGKISYPLYLLHLPIMVFARVLLPDISITMLIAVTILLGSTLSWLIYRYIEGPIRERAKARSRAGWTLAAGLAGVLVLTAGTGAHIAKQDGWGWRLAYLNSFAHSVNEAQTNAFFEKFEAGLHVDAKAKHGRILFVGDSVLQQYVTPFLAALRIEPRDADVISRGDCLLLEGLASVDYVAGVPCHTLQKALYGSTKTYDTIVIAHNWEGYVARGESEAGTREKYSPATLKKHLLKSLAKLETRAPEIIVLGWSPQVSMSLKLVPNVFLDRSTYRREVAKLSVTNGQDLVEGDRDFRKALSPKAISYIEPYRIWCPGGPADCRLHDGATSYFYDAVHFGQNAVPLVAARLRTLIQQSRAGS